MPAAQGGQASLYGSRGGVGLAAKPTACRARSLLLYKAESRSVALGYGVLDLAGGLDSLSPRKRKSHQRAFVCVNPRPLEYVDERE